MKMNLGLTAEYRNWWGTWEGVRELIQNARDAETEHGAEMSVSHKGDVLTISNKGITIPRAALLIGESSKRLRSDTIGKYGEGLTLGLLALARAGHKVRIRNGDELWAPAIEFDHEFNRRVLVINFRQARLKTIDVTVEIEGISSTAWEEYRGKFLFLSPPRNAIETTRGRLIKDHDRAGMVFVKGIYVASWRIPEGYDLDGVETDIERKMVDRWTAEAAMEAIWLEANRNGKIANAELYKKLRSPDENGVNFSKYDAHRFSDDQAKAILAEFTAEFGADAIPVSNMADAQEVEHFGLKGVVVNEALQAVAEKVTGALGDRKIKLKQEVTSTVQWADVSPEQRARVRKCLHLVQQAGHDVHLANLRFCTFRDPNLLGTCDDKQGLITIKAALLDDEPKMLGVLVHECCHMDGAADGSKEHVSAMERTWQSIYAAVTK